MKTDLFSETYAEARARFQSAVIAAGGTATAHVHPTAKGPDGGDLAMDVAWFGPSEGVKGALLNLSGTHGCEGFAGSAAQLAWLTSGGPARLPEGTGVLLVHGVNPYGFSHFSRCTEDNVDLNRNWIDFSKPLPANPNYQRYHNALTPTRITEETEKEILSELADLAQRDGSWEVEDAMSRGQYEVPDGIGFGGQAPTWSRLTLTSVIKEHLTGIPKIALLDWHTGTPGIAEIIYLCYAEPASRSFQIASQLWGEDNIRPQKVDEQWGNKRPGRKGVIVWGIQDIVAEWGGEAAGGVIEIGTRPDNDQRGAARAAIYDRYLRFEADRFAPENKPLLDTILRCFYRYDDDTWKKLAIERSGEIYTRTLAGLRDWISYGVRSTFR